MTNITRSRALGLPLAAIFIVCVVFAVSSGQAQTASPPIRPASTSAGHAVRSGRVALYEGVGADLTHYDVDIENAALIRRKSVTLPGSVQYAWPHPSGRYFYVAWSTVGPPTAGISSAGGRHGLSAFRIDKVSGALVPLGPVTALPSRPIHVSTDISGTHLLVAYNDPSGVTVHRIEPDGSIGLQVQQAAQLDVGVYAHQVRVDPSNKMVILVTRGIWPLQRQTRRPWRAKDIRLADGLLTNRASIAPAGGFNFQPRHLDFHPSQPWVFVSLERQDKIEVYEKLKDGTLSRQPLFTKDTVADPVHIRPGQEAGTIHIHPNGRFVYVANRATGTADSQGKPAFVGGENSIAVFAINQKTAEPTLIQSIDTRGMTPRTFALDPAARILVAANQLPLATGEGISVKTVPPNLAMFRVRGDGKLDFVRTYDVHAGDGKMLFWMGLVPLP